MQKLSQYAAGFETIKSSVNAEDGTRVPPLDQKIRNKATTLIQRKET